MTDILSKFQSAFEQVLEHLRVELSGIRTGRANPSLVENVSVEAYGSHTTLVGLASLSIPDARTILIDPWDKSLLKDIEKAITEAKLGVNPVVQGQQIRISLPMMTEENRKNLIKVVNEKLEQARIGVRGVRDQAKADIQRAEKENEIAEDQKYKLLEQLDKVAAGFNERIKNIGIEKEKEIMTI